MTSKNNSSLAQEVMMEIEASKPQDMMNVMKIGGGLSPLSKTLWKEKTNTEIIRDVSARLAWKDLKVMVTRGNGETQNILKGLTSYAEPGTFTSLMGHSGLGKSTLLDALSGCLAANDFLSRNILLNSHKAKLSFRKVAYVTQDEKLDRYSDRPSDDIVFSRRKRANYFE